MKKIKGEKITAGIAIGPTYHFIPNQFSIPSHSIDKEDVSQELLRLHKAISKCVNELSQIRELVLHHLDEDHARIIDGQLMILTDEDILAEVEKTIHNEHKNAVQSFFEVLSKYANILSKSRSEYHKQRDVDIDDVKKRMIHHLMSKDNYMVVDVDEPVIFVSERISPSDLIHLDPQKALGIITKIGGVDSHIAILSKAFGIPYISNVTHCEKIAEKSEVIIDAYEGQVILDPDTQTRAYYQNRLAEFEKSKRAVTDKSVEQTKDGVPFHVSVNAGFISELDAIDISAAHSIGLFRTEFLSIERNAIPNEEDQYKAYKKVVEKAQGIPVIFRTFDFGRDKFVAMLDMEIFHKDKSFQDWGGIQFCLENPEILKTQFRAILRVSALGPVKIMLPMVSNLEEVAKSKTLLEEVKATLKADRIRFDQNIDLGVMIETKSILDHLNQLPGQAVAFFSIGTNDLALYLMGGERDETLIKNHYHPKMFKAIKQIVETGEKHGIPVAVCGEMGSDPYALIGLAAVGIRNVSVSTNAFHQINQEVKNLNIHKAQSLRENILSSTSAYTIYNLLRSFYREHITPDG